MKEELCFEQFYKENYTRFYYFAFQMIGVKELCQDIVGEAFEQTWLLYHQGKESNLTAYMYSLIRNKCVDYIRHETAKARYADFYQSMYSEAGDSGDGDEMEEQITQMYDTLSHFTPKTQKILEMCYFQKKTYSETAAELEISVSAVRKHIVNALKAFRVEFAKKSK